MDEQQRARIAIELGRLTQDKLVWLSARSAARCLPELYSIPEGPNFDRLLLGTLRSIQYCFVTVHTMDSSESFFSWEVENTAKIQADKIARYVSTAEKIAIKPNLFAKRQGAFFAARASGHALYCVFGKRNGFSNSHAKASAENASHALAYSARLLGEGAVRQHKYDLSNLISEGPLWNNDSAPNDFVEGWAKLKGRLLDHEKKWMFWVAWYDQLLFGSQFDRKLHVKISEIEDRSWDSGPIQVSGNIAEITLRLNLQRELDKAASAASASSETPDRHGIGGNNPPEDMQIEPQIIRETTIIWAAVEELKAETEKDAPNKSTVLQSIETLGRALKAILAWLAQKGDLSVDTLIKWGIPIGGAAVLANPKLVADVIEAAKVWVPFLP